MPARILYPAILKSTKVAQLSWAAEVFYRRLMSVIDDFGRYEDNSLLADLYPVQLDKVSSADVDKWKLETVEAGLVSLYDVAGKRYLVLHNFQQKTRTKSKFPDPPPEACRHLLTNVGKCRQMLTNVDKCRTLTYSESESNAQAQSSSDSDAHDDDNVNIGKIEDEKPEKLVDFLQDNTEAEELARQMYETDGRMDARCCLAFLPDALSKVSKDFIVQVFKTFLKSGGGSASRFKAYLDASIGREMAKSLPEPNTAFSGKQKADREAEDIARSIQARRGARQ